MTYKELFKDFYGTDIIDQSIKNAKLYHAVRTVAETSPAINMVFMTWNEAYDPIMHPDKLTQHCRNLGFPEWADLEKFMQAVDKTGFDFSFIDRLYNPPFPELGETETMAAIHVHRAIRVTGFPISPFDINIVNDSEYELLTKDDLMKVIKANQSDKYVYMKERRDCDKFTRIFRGWLARKGKGNLAIFELKCNMIYESGNTMYHSMCMALTKEKQVWIFEPQDDRYVWKFGDPVDWPGVTRVEPVQING